MRLQDLISIDDLDIEAQDGFVRERKHPTSPYLVILNYTEKAQYERRWNDITSQCRGLIVDALHGGVVARPFSKFFNYGEFTEGTLRLDAPVEVSDKMDGSLGICFVEPGTVHPQIATRGSFISDQAIHGGEVLRERYIKTGKWFPHWGVTYLFEIIFPENRIVLDYGDLDDLVLLGAVEIETGIQHGPDYDSLWPGPRAEVFGFGTLAEALAAPPRPNAEGFVVRYLDTGERVKIKQEDYVRLHKLVTGLNERAVWEHLSQHGGDISGLVEAIPDEFHAWVREISQGFLDRFDDVSGGSHAAYDEILDDLSVLYGEHGVFERKAFAERARESVLAPMLFMLLDGRDISAAVWKTLQPKGDTKSLMNRNEDNS